MCNTMKQTLNFLWGLPQHVVRKQQLKIDNGKKINKKNIMFHANTFERPRFSPYEDNGG